jgi:ABC-2 type transport system permease protein
MNPAITLWQRQMKKSFVHIEEILGTLLQPILWVILFGVGMRSFLGAMGPGDGDSYMTFVLPGIVAFTVVGAASGGGFTWLSERIRGINKEYLVAPIPRISILMGHALSITTRVLIQTVIIILVGLITGARLSSNPLGWIGGFLLIAGFAIGFSGISLAVASTTDSSEGYHVMIFALQLPLMFLSNSLYPLATMPTWLRIGSLLNPTTYAVTGIRAVMMAPIANGSGADVIPVWLCFLVIAAFAAIGMGVALRAFKKTIK